MPRVPRVTNAEALRVLNRKGWYQVRQTGSHVHLQSQAHPGTLTVPAHAGAIIKPGTLKGIIHDAGMTVEEFRQGL